MDTERKTHNPKHPKLRSISESDYCGTCSEGDFVSSEDVTLHGLVAFFKAIEAALVVKMGSLTVKMGALTVKMGALTVKMGALTVKVVTLG